MYKCFISIAYVSFALVQINRSMEPVHQPGLQTSSGGSTNAPACAATWLLPYRLRVLLLDLCPAAA